MAKKLTEKQALELSIKIWDPVPMSIEEKRRRAEEMGSFKSACPLCEWWSQRPFRGSRFNGCKGCALNEAGEHCLKKGSAYADWDNLFNYGYHRLSEEEAKAKAIKAGNRIAQICRDRLKELEA
jgi:hypothetical protein